MERLYVGSSLLVLTIFGTIVTIKCKYSGEVLILPSYFNYYMGLKTGVQVKHGEMVDLCVAGLHTSIVEVYRKNDWHSGIDARSGFTKYANKVRKKAKSVEKIKAFSE